MDGEDDRCSSRDDLPTEDSRDSLISFASLGDSLKEWEEAEVGILLPTPFTPGLPLRVGFGVEPLPWEPLPGEGLSLRSLRGPLEPAAEEERVLGLALRAG